MDQLKQCCDQQTDGGWNIYHTGVSPDCQGKGIAKRLVYKVLEEAERGKNDFRALFYGNEIAGFKFHKDGKLYYYNKFENDDLC